MRLVSYGAPKTPISDVKIDGNVVDSGASLQLAGVTGSTEGIGKLHNASAEAFQ